MKKGFLIFGNAVAATMLNQFLCTNEGQVSILIARESGADTKEIDKTIEKFEKQKSSAKITQIQTSVDLGCSADNVNTETLLKEMSLAGTENVVVVMSEKCCRDAVPALKVSFGKTTVNHNTITCDVEAKKMSTYQQKLETAEV